MVKGVPKLLIGGVALYVYDAEYIEVKIKATAVMDRMIDKFFANIGGSAQQLEF